MINTPAVKEKYSVAINHGILLQFVFTELKNPYGRISLALILLLGIAETKSITWRDVAFWFGGFS